MRLARAVLWVAVASGSAVAVACGGAGDEPPGDVLVSEGEFWGAMRNGACDGYGACCGAHQFAFRLIRLRCSVTPERPAFVSSLQ